MVPPYTAYLLTITLSKSIYFGCFEHLSNEIPRRIYEDGYIVVLCLESFCRFTKLQVPLEILSFSVALWQWITYSYKELLEVAC